MPDTTDLLAPFDFSNSYARLPDRFYARLSPAPVAKPGLIALNDALARELRLDPDACTADQWAAILSGNTLPQGAEPLAMAYAGHQFGGWVPQLGDGRAILLGEVLDTDGQRRDIQLKGAGRTPFSRGGDGRAWLGPVLREYVVSEAMHALGIPTTRALAAVATGETVLREAALPGAILTRVAASHIRVGTFQYFAARNDVDALQLLTEHALDRHYPDTERQPNAALSLLGAVVGAQARLIAEWMGVGFIHGVMNTDNMAISGQTIDYGPCAFIDGYHPEKVFSSIDQYGRYAYRNQPQLAHWNLAQFASALLPIIDQDTDAAIAKATEVLDDFPPTYETEWRRVFTAKIGMPGGAGNASELARDLLDRMAAVDADFTLTFRALRDLTETGGFPAGTAANTAPLDDWLPDWRKNLPPDARETLRRTNPAIIPRNHRVESMIQAAVGGDFGPFADLTAALADPFADNPDFATPPNPEEEVTQTFCGT